MRKLILKDQTEFNDASLTFDSYHNTISIIVQIPSLIEAIPYFSDPLKTEEIIFISDIHKNTYTGFTKLTCIQYYVEDSSVHVDLKGEDKSSVSIDYMIPDEYLPEGLKKEEFDNA